MIDHTGITVSDLARSRAFYERTLAPLRYRIVKQFPDACGFGVTEGFGRSPDPGGDFWIILGKPMEPRVHFAFTAASRTDVNAFFAAAIAAGGRDNGGPGLRPRYHADYYAAFILDPDGYNIEAVSHSRQG
jgi:catechol 2,3-dioxygenase-like lactoylglutathione lyase family enzyme